MFGLFGQKKKVERLREDIQESFDHVKRDFNKVGEWIKHLDDKHVGHEDEIVTIKEELMRIHQDLMEIKDFVSFFGPQVVQTTSKQTQTNTT